MCPRFEVPGRRWLARGADGEPARAEEAIIGEQQVASEQRGTSNAISGEHADRVVEEDVLHPGLALPPELHDLLLGRGRTGDEERLTIAGQGETYPRPPERAVGVHRIFGP